MVKSNGTDDDKLKTIYQLYQVLLEHITDQAPIGFTSLFARLIYVLNRFNINRQNVFLHHHFRRSFPITDDKSISELIHLGNYLIHTVIKTVYPEISIPEIETPNVQRLEPSPKHQFQRSISGMIIDFNGEKEQFIFVSEAEAHEKLLCTFSTKKFDQQARIIFKHLDFPISVNLIDCDINEDSYITAKAFVLQPDFLVSVTAIAECFQSEGPFSMAYLVKKLTPTEPTVHMLIGNVVNHLLDELVHNPGLEFSDIAPSLFSLAPEQFSLMTDADLVTCLDKVKNHFENLKSVVNNDLNSIGIEKENTYLEPSFYAPQYGIYGRLDLYHFDEAKDQSNIVELKSGKLFKPNNYGLNENHYVQTLLYDLMIEAVMRGKTKSNNYILYSSLKTEGLKFAPKVRAKQYEALFVRNDIIMIESFLSRIDEAFPLLLNKIHPEHIREGFTFVQRDAKRFLQAFSKLNAYEIEYFKSFVAFISREYHLAKVGEHGLFKTNGMASLWLNSQSDKIDQFAIFVGMEISANNSSDTIPTIDLKFTETSNRISKFRVGDIVVLYPNVDRSTDILNHQIFKSTILELNNEGIVLRLRARQKNTEVFETYQSWNIEGDSLDSGFNQQFNGLFEFINSSVEYRNVWLGIEAPSKPLSITGIPAYPKMTDEQSGLLKEAISAQDYYLLWGPPGTGKTSMMIHHLVKYYIEQTDKTLLLLAYTNRAVDEICKAIKEVTNDSYIRIGSRYSAGKEYKSKLLSVLSDELTSRKELIQKISSTRVFVSTVSSFQGKRELLKFKKFDLSIIDEASQLLEPMLLGLLKHFNKSILIGDHKQLPAVVAQSEDKRLIKSKDLIEKTSISDCGMSLFERLYRQCQERKWNWAFGALSFQGRMHQDIQRFVSENFYEGSLKSLNKIERLSSQFADKIPDGVKGKLIENRMIFINIPVQDSFASKTNHLESELVCKLVELWEENYRLLHKEINSNTIGVISPFRAQIAHIKSKMNDRLSELITVDTIERYQGGARNQIILSLAVNRVELLDSITNINEEGIDRKLNVALTRAKEHIVILGNKYILSKNPIYNTLINQCTTLELEEII